jgi:hypothetical protein
MAKTKGVGLSNSGSSVVDHLPIHPEVKDLSCVAANGIRRENGKYERRRLVKQRYLSGRPPAHSFQG